MKSCEAPRRAWLVQAPHARSLGRTFLILVELTAFISTGILKFD